MRNRLLRGDPYLMIFLAENDEKNLKKTMALMAKFEKVRVIFDIVTLDG